MSKPYVIQFEQMSLGQHTLDFEAGKDVFEVFGDDRSEVIDTQMHIDLDLYKSSNMMDLRFDFRGSFTLLCDRCNEEMKVPVETEKKLVLKYGQAHHEDFDELIVLEDHEHEIDLGQFFYESMTLMIPARHVHEEKDCDPDIIKRLKLSEAKEEDEDIDPRWEKLKGL